MERSELLFIIGSLRKDGFNYQLSKVFKDLLKDRFHKAERGELCQ